MRRRTFDRLAATSGLIVAAILLATGSLLMWGHNFADSQVHNQLAQQQITFPAATSPAIADPAIKPYLTKYAGQQMVNGAQAKAYADHFIAVHLEKAGGGQTYAQLSSKAQANPKDAALAAQVETMFKGETLRGMLLNAYAFWKMGQIALWAAMVSFVGSALMMVLAGLGLYHGRRVNPQSRVFGEHEAIYETV
jgi:hypothetical protein